ncbi:MAG: nitroreductase [Polyangiaceae bacterium]|nr:nitroreductase [Polyangiaceae bacterium]
MDLDKVIGERRSVRAFLPNEVPRDTLRSIFERAQRAPSWCNIQPWRAFVASGEVRERLTTAIAREAREGAPRPDVPFPVDYPEPYGSHRRACGRALYEAMGVERHDSEARQRAWLRNFVAFDAPHVVICGIDRRFELWAALDVGCWLQTLLLLATSEGVATCAQASLSLYPDIAREILGIPEEVKVLFGIAMGYEDTSAAANRCRTARDHAEINVTFRG